MTLLTLLDRPTRTRTRPARLVTGHGWSPRAVADPTTTSGRGAA
jgi:hypothetical protein